MQLELKELRVWLLPHTKARGRSAVSVMVCNHTRLSTNQDDQDIYKRFLFHYSRTQKPIHPVKSGFPPVHPLMRMAAQLANRKVKRFPQQRDSGTAAVDFTKKDHTATWGQPFFLFRPRNGRNTEDNTQ
ncbi:neuromedin-S isoform X2 [Meles meles]|uniref:neuromedin-S isoform X2 n=1 Tax=Meles meles TaxID=9662 RepID=UPI001E69FEB0|nr:neuromedin-S isoform X2 [Meles meles]XP_045837306.1 neuromedin-S isoform X2 [Meles meles]